MGQPRAPSPEPQPGRRCIRPVRRLAGPQCHPGALWLGCATSPSKGDSRSPKPGRVQKSLGGGPRGRTVSPPSHMLPRRGLQAATPLFFLSSPCHLSVPADLSPTGPAAAGARTVPASLVVALGPCKPSTEGPWVSPGQVSHPMSLCNSSPATSTS